MPFPTQVKIVEVSPRDGLQNEAQFIPTEIKIKFIHQLSETGLSIIEATSFVSARWIPQLADGHEVFSGIAKKTDVRYPVLVPNMKGLEAALTAGAKAIAVFTTPSEEFSQKNTNCSVEESLTRIETVAKKAKEESCWVRAYVSCVLGCPYEGEMAPEKVARLTRQLFQMSCDEISLGDTIGVGTPFKTKRLIEAVAAHVPIKQLAVHFHDTYGQALANIYAALELGIAIIDSSVAGLGGCPYATGATGNVATEDVLYMLEGMDIKTGVDLKKMITVGRWISTQLKRESRSKVSRAMRV